MCIAFSFCHLPYSSAHEIIKTSFTFPILIQIACGAYGMIENLELSTEMECYGFQLKCLKFVLKVKVVIGFLKHSSLTSKI